MLRPNFSKGGKTPWEIIGEDRTKIAPEVLLFPVVDIDTLFRVKFFIPQGVRLHLPLPDLTNQLAYGLSKIWLNDKTTNRILQDFEEYRGKENNNDSVQIQQIEKQLVEIQQKLDRLLDGYVSGLITPAEYQEKKQVLIEQKMN